MWQVMGKLPPFLLWEQKCCAVDADLTLHQSTPDTVITAPVFGSSKERIAARANRRLVIDLDLLPSIAQWAMLCMRFNSIQRTTLTPHVCNAEPLDEKDKQMYTFQAMQVSQQDASDLRR